MSTPGRLAPLTSHDPDITVGERAPGDDPEVAALLVDLALDEQDRYDHPRRTRRQIESATAEIPARFQGENVVLVARERSGGVVGFAWCTLHDPGNGLEGELAELYVRPRVRGRGVAHLLCAEAIALFRRRRVTLASVWTRHDNPAALAAYRAAGFTPTDQTVLTWLPLPGR